LRASRVAYLPIENTTLEETTMAETGAQTGEAAAATLTTWVEHAATGIELG
jgi:hypothetical protein